MGLSSGQQSKGMYLQALRVSGRRGKPKIEFKGANENSNLTLKVKAAGSRAGGIESFPWKSSLETNEPHRPLK